MVLLYNVIKKNATDEQYTFNIFIFIGLSIKAVRIIIKTGL